MQNDKYAHYIICIRTALNICITILMIAALPLPSYAAGDGVIAADSVSAAPGETADIAVRIENNPGIVAVMLHIDYDPSVLTLTGVENGDIFADDAAVFGKDRTSAPYTVLWEDGLSPENYTADGVLVTLHFKTNADAPKGTYPIGIDLDASSTFDVDLNKIPFRLENGAVQIGAARTSRHTDILIAGIAAAAMVCMTIAATVFSGKRRKHAGNGSVEH